MALNIIDLIKGQLGPALVSQSASTLGESESGISKAIGGLLPAVLGGLANNSNNPSVLDAITGASSSGILGNLLGGTQNNSIITTILHTIFGDKVNGLINAIASYSGVNNNSASHLLNLVTGATLGSVGKYAADNNLDRSGISNLLNEQKGVLSSLLPAGLSLASLGFGNWFGQSDAPRTHTTDAPKVEVTRGGNVHTTPTENYNTNNDNGGGSIWKWLLPLLLLLVAGWFIWKQCDKKDVDNTVVTTDSTAVQTDTAVIAPGDTATVTTTTRVDEDIDLNGVKLKGYKDGMEDRMIAFLKSDGYKNATDDAALKDIWYDFDHVNFKMGSSNELEAGSQAQLDNLVAILKAFPDAKIKIGGYTDKTGDEANNVKLSGARAMFIKDALTKAGVGAQVLGAEGYGSKFATVAKEASDAERAVDRKMSVRFAK